MRIVGRRHSRTYQPELCISIRALGAQAFIVTAFAPRTWVKDVAQLCNLDNLALFIILHLA